MTSDKTESCLNLKQP